MKRRIIQLVLAASVTTISMSANAYAAGWQKNAVGWWWQNDDGSWPANSWQWLDGNNDGVAECYYFDGNGYMFSNARTPDNYEVNADGAWVVNGAIQVQIGTSNQGQGQAQSQVQNGWSKENNSWRYYINGKTVTDWRKIDGKRYYFDDSGTMLTGFHDIDGSLYYFNDSGDLQTKSFNRSGIHYEITSDGVITSEQDEEEWKYESSTSQNSNSSSSGSSGNSSASYYSYSYAQASGDTSDYARKVLDLVNEERQKAGKSPLSWDDGVADCASVRAEELTSLFSHDRPDGSSCFTVLGEHGVSSGYKGENIAAGQTTPQQVMDSWMNSSGHKRNILDSNYKKLGVGFYQGGGSYRYYWVQLFTD